MSEDTKWPARLKNLAELGLRGKPPVGTTPADVVHRENKWSLLRYRRAAPASFATPVLLVPSLINRHYVLDLLPGKSLAEWLVARGHDVFVIDWGTPGDEDRFVTFDDVCDRAIGRALRKTASFGARGKAHLLHVIDYLAGDAGAAAQRAAGLHSRNEPAELPRIGAVLADLRGWTLPQCAAITSANVRQALPRLQAPG